MMMKQVPKQKTIALNSSMALCFWLGFLSAYLYVIQFVVVTGALVQFSCRLDLNWRESIAPALSAVLTAGLPGGLIGILIAFSLKRFNATWKWLWLSLLVTHVSCFAAASLMIYAPPARSVVLIEPDTLLFETEIFALVFWLIAVPIIALSKLARRFIK